MNARERMLAVYRGQRPDRIPVSIYRRYLSLGNTERLARNIGLGITEHYPPVSLLVPPWHLLPGFVSEVEGVDLQVRHAWRGGRMLERRTYDTPVGSVYQETAKDDGYGSDVILSYFIKEPGDYQIVQYLVERTIFRRNYEPLLTIAADLGADGLVLGRLDRSPYQKLLVELAGPERFLTDLYLEPEPVLALLEAMDRRLDESFEMAVDADVDVFWQPDNITVDLTPPAAFREHCLPFYERRSSVLRSAGKPYVVHLDGRLGPLVEAITDAPFDVVELFSLPQVGNDMSLVDAFRAWPNKVVIPNFPSPLCLQPSEQIQDFLLALFLEVPDERPFMLEISEDVPRNEWQRVVSLICSVVDGLP